jgi:ankyrin repeat protein
VTIGWTPILLTFAYNGRIDIVEKLLEGKASLGRTSFMLATVFDRTEVMRLILDRRAEVDHTTSGALMYQSQPINSAAIFGHHNCLRLLLDHRASANVLDTFGLYILSLLAVIMVKLMSRNCFWNAMLMLTPLLGPPTWLVPR